MLRVGQSFIAEAVMGFFVSVFGCLVRGAEQQSSNNVDEMNNSELEEAKEKFKLMTGDFVRMRVERKCMLRKKLGLPPLQVNSSDEAFAKMQKMENDGNPRFVFK